MSIGNIVDDIRDKLLHGVEVYPNAFKTSESPQYNWCIEQFGPELYVDIGVDRIATKYQHNPDGRWDHYGYQPTTFCFRDQDDAILFKLTWGGK